MYSNLTQEFIQFSSVFKELLPFRVHSVVADEYREVIINHRLPSEISNHVVNRSISFFFLFIIIAARIKTFAHISLWGLGLGMSASHSWDACYAVQPWESKQKDLQLTNESRGSLRRDGVVPLSSLCPLPETPHRPQGCCCKAMRDWLGMLACFAWWRLLGGSLLVCTHTHTPYSIQIIRCYGCVQGLRSHRSIR